MKNKLTGRTWISVMFLMIILSWPDNAYIYGNKWYFPCFEWYFTDLLKLIKRITHYSLFILFYQSWQFYNSNYHNAPWKRKWLHFFKDKFWLMIQLLVFPNWICNLTDGQVTSREGHTPTYMDLFNWAQVTPTLTPGTHTKLGQWTITGSMKIPSLNQCFWPWSNSQMNIPNKTICKTI